MRRFVPLWSFAPLVLASACLKELDERDETCDGATVYEDADGDGRGNPEVSASSCDVSQAWVETATDCDDSDATIHPGAEETWYDGVDQDCDEASDYDQDGDGHDSDQHGGQDCDDQDAAVNPDAEDAWYDGMDSDCDGASDYDQDGDGYDAGQHGGDDCDDEDAMVHPGAFEYAGDGIDNDCDGREDGSMLLSGAGVILVGENNADCFGEDVAVVGDVDGDGLGEVLVGAANEDSGRADAGAAYLFSGADLADGAGELEASAAVAKLQGDSSEDYLGQSQVGAGDVNGDGYADLVLGAGWAQLVDGIAYVVHGPVEGTMAVSAAGVAFSAETGESFLGWCVAGGGDVDGDGLDDVLVGAPEAYSGEDGYGGLQYAGAAYLLAGPAEQGGSVSGARAKLSGIKDNDSAGYAVAVVGDTDGDGTADLLVGAPSAEGDVVGSGAAYLVQGPVQGEVSLKSADAVLAGQEDEDAAGQEVSGAGDVNGDGKADILVGAPLAAAGGVHQAGKAYIVLGPIEADLSLGSANARFEGSQSMDHAGTVAAAGDVDADGLDDVLIGAYATDDMGDNSGAAYLVLGSIGGVIDADSADTELLGETEGDEAGYALAGGLVDEDSHADLLISAHYNDRNGSSAGTAYLVFGGPEY